MVESSYDAHYVTVIDVTIEVKDEGGTRVMTWWPQFRVIDTATVTPDPEVAAVVAGLRGAAQPGARPADRHHRGRTRQPRTRRCARAKPRSAHLIADAMRRPTHADAAVTNGGGIRGGRIYAPGTPITRRDILAELPFDNRVVAIEISGADLRRAIENGLSQLPNPAGRFPQVSGLTIEADPSRPPGSRVLSIKVGDAPLDENKTYRVATNDFMLRGGDGYIMFRDATPLLPANDAPLLSTEVMDYIERHRDDAHRGRRPHRAEVDGSASAFEPAQRSWRLSRSNISINAFVSLIERAAARNSGASLSIVLSGLTPNIGLLSAFTSAPQAKAR